MKTITAFSVMWALTAHPFLLTAAETIIHAVDVDEVLEESRAVAAVQAEWDRRKAETGPQTALSQKQRAYKSLLEDAAALARELNEPDLEAETRASIETRLDRLKGSAKVIELEIKDEAAGRLDEIRETAAKARKGLLTELHIVVEQMSKENRWETVVMRYRGGDLPDTLLGEARNVVWVTDEVINRWNALTLKGDHRNHESVNGDRPAHSN